VDFLFSYEHLVIFRDIQMFSDFLKYMMFHILWKPQKKLNCGNSNKIISFSTSIFPFCPRLFCEKWREFVFSFRHDLYACPVVQKGQKRGLCSWEGTAEWRSGTRRRKALCNGPTRRIRNVGCVVALLAALLPFSFISIFCMHCWLPLFGFNCCTTCFN